MFYFPKETYPKGNNLFCLAQVFYSPLLILGVHDKNHYRLFVLSACIFIDFSFFNSELNLVALKSVSPYLKLIQLGYNFKLTLRLLKLGFVSNLAIDLTSLSHSYYCSGLLLLFLFSHNKNY